MSRTSSWEGTQKQLVMPCEEMSLASACVPFSIPGADSTTLPPHANALNSSCRGWAREHTRKKASCSLPGTSRLAHGTITATASGLLMQEELSRHPIEESKMLDAEALLQSGQSETESGHAGQQEGLPEQRRQS